MPQNSSNALWRRQFEPFRRIQKNIQGGFYIRPDLTAKPASHFENIMKNMD